MTPTANRPTRRRGLRATWGVVDQALSSLMGLALSVVAAHVANPTEFGAFAVALAVYYFVLGVSRALTSDVIMVRFSQGDEHRVNDARASAAGAALAMGIALGMITIGVSRLVEGELRGSLAAIGLMLPFLLLQDLTRLSFFAALRGHLSFVVDAIWACATLGLVALTLALGIRNPSALIIGWGLAAGIAAVVGLRVARTTPRPNQAPRWLRAHRDLGLRFLAEVSLMTGVGSLALILVGLISGLHAAGALRGAAVLLGPISLLVMASVTFGVPEGVVAHHHSTSALRALVLQISLVVTTVAIVWTIALTLLPSGVGSRILGDSWTGAHEVVLPMGIAACAGGAMSGALIGLRALAAARQSLHARMILAPLVLAGALSGAVVNGASGAAIGMAIAYCLGTLIAWRSFGSTLGRETPRGDNDRNAAAAADLVSTRLSA